jgi:hypothetical protein
MTSSTPALAPMDHVTAERIASLALRWPVPTVVGPRVLAALLVRITALELERAQLRRELDSLAARAQEEARLRAHKMWAQRGLAGVGADTEGAG